MNPTQYGLIAEKTDIQVIVNGCILFESKHVTMESQ